MSRAKYLDTPAGRRALGHQAAVRARDSLGLVTRRLHGTGLGRGPLTPEDWRLVAKRARDAVAYASSLAQYADHVAAYEDTNRQTSAPFELNWLKNEETNR